MGGGSIAMFLQNRLFGFLSHVFIPQSFYYNTGGNGLVSECGSAGLICGSQQPHSQTDNVMSQTFAGSREMGMGVKGGVASLPWM